MANVIVPARGMRDMLPKSKAKRDRVLAQIRDVYTRSGFQEIETPAVEPLSRLTSGEGGDNEKMLFQIMRRGLPADGEVSVHDAADLGLRYDLTVPLTRYYATNHLELPRVFRSFQAGPVWRAERPQKGRFRQFVQCDIDIIGDPSITAEVDLVVSTYGALKVLGLAQGATVLVNDRRILLDMLAAGGVAEENADQALISLDKADKIGFDAVRSELITDGIAKEASVDRLLDLVKKMGDAGSSVLDAGEVDGVSLYDVPNIINAVREIVPGVKIIFDPTLVRGMGYYTGPIFEVKHERVPYSIAGGGRYDRVVGKWLGKDVPACGFSIGFERIVDLVEEGVDAGTKVALLYKPGGNPVPLLELKYELQNQGMEVSLVAPPRRPNSLFFSGLSDDGYTHMLDGRREGALPSDLKALG